MWATGYLTWNTLRHLSRILPFRRSSVSHFSGTVAAAQSRRRGVAGRCKGTMGLARGAHMESWSPGVLEALIKLRVGCFGGGNV